MRESRTLLLSCKSEFELLGLLSYRECAGTLVQPQNEVNKKIWMNNLTDGFLIELSGIELAGDERVSGELK